MDTDILAHWKTSRFVIAPDYIVADLDTLHLIVLSDFGFWSEHVDQLLEWCQTHGAKISGMTVEIPTDELLSMFVLRWS